MGRADVAVGRDPRCPVWQLAAMLAPTSPRKQSLIIVLTWVACGGSSTGAKVPALDADRDSNAAAPLDAGRDSSAAGPADVGNDSSVAGLADLGSDRSVAAPADVGIDSSAAASPDVGSPPADVARDSTGPEVAPADRPPAGRDSADATQTVPDSGPRDLAFDGPLSGPDLFTGVAPVTYTNDPNTIFANPERGFYAMYETYASAYQSLSQSELQNLRTQSAVSLVMREWYLDSFVNSDLTQGFLDKVAADFNIMRLAGVKAVLRFAYTSNSTKPYGDANKARLLGHIAQLKPILFANSDVIAVLQAGFIGAWGEWYYTDYFGDNGTISASQWTDRQDVVAALLDALDLLRPIQLRTPAFKQHFYGTAALTSAEAFSSTAKARVGHHNDCFLADATDMGTYANVAADKAYLAAENLYVPQGGETCATSTYSAWSNATQDMANLHWSFLNQDYHPDVLASWGTNIDIAKRRLGYRLSLDSGSYSTIAKTGGQFEASLSIRNDGYAAPFNPRGMSLILRNTNLGTIYLAKLPDDPRRFTPGSTTTISHKFCLPSDIAAGTYALLLSLADPVPVLATRPEYAIRLANQNTWEASTGYNNLNRALIVSPSFTTASCTADDIPVSLGN